MILKKNQQNKNTKKPLPKPKKPTPQTQESCKRGTRVKVHFNIVIYRERFSNLHKTKRGSSRTLGQISIHMFCNKRLTVAFEPCFQSQTMAIAEQD